MNKIFLTLVCLSSIALGNVAQAVTFNSTVGGSAVPDATYENFDDAILAPGLSSIILETDSAVVTGSVPGQYAAPFASGNNNLFFGSPTYPVAGAADDSPYLTTGSISSYPNAKVILSFAEPKNYLGLLWGSIDNYNTLELFSSADGSGPALATITGSMVSASPTGSQEIDGTAYVNIISTVDFRSAVFTSSQYAFEFDNVAFNSIPDGGTTVAMLGMGISILVLLRRK